MYIAEDFDLYDELYEYIEAPTVVYETPFANYTLGKIRFINPELLFQPNLRGWPIEGPGLSEAIIEAVEKSDESVRSKLWFHIILGGGNTLFPGIEERLLNDLSPVASDTVNVIAQEGREYSAFIGAANP